MHRARIPRIAAFVVSLFLASACSDDAGVAGGGAGAAVDDGGSGEGNLAVVPGQDARIALNEIAYKYDYLDPKQDGWNTEVLASKVKDQLHHIAELFEDPARIAAGELASVATADFAPTNLTGELGPVAYTGGGHGVVRASFPGSVRADASSTPAGPASLAAALTDFARAYLTGSAADGHAHFKVVHIDAPAFASEFTTDVRLELSGPTAAGRDQQTARWRCTWKPVAGEELPRLRAIEPSFHERVEAAVGSGATLFEDCTESVLAGDTSYAAQLLRSQRDSATELDKSLGTAFLGHVGIAVADANGDGLDDLYVCMEGGLPNRLFLQQQDGTARDAAAAAGLDYLDLARSALFIDLDGDGDQDCLVATYPVLVHENVGEGRFEKRAELPLTNVYSMTAADYDVDGDLDVYLCRYNGNSTNVPLPYLYVTNWGPNVLLRNDGDWNFSDATAAVGLDDNNARFSFAGSWVDYDDDGDMDLYVANDYGRNNLYENEGGRFHDAAAETGTEDISAGMSVAWGDANADGRPDLYVSNMFSSAGKRIAFQRSFRDGDEADLGSLRRHARGNSLFVNGGAGTFHDVSEEAGVTMARWAWGSLFADLNNDGLEDLYAVNGLVTNEDSGDL